MTAWRTARKHKSRSGYGRVAPHVRPKAATVPRRGRCRMLRVLNGKVHACGAQLRGVYYDGGA